MKFGNCWIYAVRRWLKEGTADSYLIIRRSRHSWVWHVMWSPSIEHNYIEEFKPRKPKHGLLWRLFPLYGICFRGRIRRGWGEENAGTKVGIRSEHHET